MSSFQLRAAAAVHSVAISQWKGVWQPKTFAREGYGDDNQKCHYLWLHSLSNVHYFQHINSDMVLKFAFKKKYLSHIICQTLPTRDC